MLLLPNGSTSAFCSPPHLGETDPHFHHQDARTESRVRDVSGILVIATQVERTLIHVSARRDYYVPTPTWWLALEVPYGFPARMPRMVAYSGTALRRGESTAAAAILATQWVLEVAGVWYATARTKGFLWHLPAGVVDRRAQLHLANLAEGADPEAQAYLSKLLDLHQSLDWAAAGPYRARRVGGEDDRAARAFVHCDKSLVEGRIGLHEGLGDASYLYAAGVTATSAPPELGCGAPGAVSPHKRKRTWGAADLPPTRGGAIRRTARAGPSPVRPATRPTFSPPGVPYYPALGAGQNLSWGYVTRQCARALATTNLTPLRRRRRVQRRARRGGRFPRVGDRPTSTHSTRPYVTTTGGTPATTSRGRRTGVRDSCPTVRGRGNAKFSWSRLPSCLSRVGSVVPPD